MIYLDNNATTRPLPEVVSAITYGLKDVWGNPSSPHSLGAEASRYIAKAREQVATLLGTSPECIVFTSGATEANEAVLRHHMRLSHKLVTSTAEHPAVDGLFRRLAPERVQEVPVDSAGRWDLDVLEKLVDGPSTLIAAGWANGETGVLQDIEQICQIACNHNQPVLIDASQVVGRHRFITDKLGGSYLSLSGHKLHAPKGIGAMVKIQHNQNNDIFGQSGEQEGGQRGGTENVPGIIGLGQACALRQETLEEAICHLGELRDKFEATLLRRIRNIRINGINADRVPNTSNITFEGIDGMALVARLDQSGVICSQVSACSSQKPEPSRTLTAMGHSQSEAFSSVRFSFSVDNTISEVEHATEYLVKEVAALRQLMGNIA